MGVPLNRFGIALIVDPALTHFIRLNFRTLPLEHSRLLLITILSYDTPIG